jgi:hypothetical protein
MVRPIKKRDATGKIYKVVWTPQNGYMCRNQECHWVSDNQKKSGAAWHQAQLGKLVQHKPGTYVDWGLAAHADCGDEHIQGRQCMRCKQTDGVWVPQPSKRFKKFFTATVVDEAHNMKTHTGNTYRAISRLRCRRKYGMTGTFISNGPSDAFWILLWVLGGPNGKFPYAYSTGAKAFDDRFCEHVMMEKPAGIDEETGQVLKKMVSKKLPFLKNPADWWRFIAPKFLRRNYSDPLYEQSLLEAGMFKPNIEIQKMVCPMTPEQIKLMLSAMQNFKDVYDQHKVEAENQNKDINKAFVIRQMSTMCTIATSPEVMNQKFGKTVYTGPDGGGKLYPVVASIKEKVAAGSKALVLADSIAMQVAMTKALREEGLKVIRFLPSWGLEKRREAQELFLEDPEHTVMVAGTRSVSEALDLSSADWCFCMDMLWAPAFQQQAWSRILQAIKRKRTCGIVLVCSGNSIDEHKFDTFYSKLVASEQSQDRKVVSKRAMVIDMKSFAEKVLVEQEHLSLQLRELGLGDESFFLPEFNTDFLEARMV